MTEKPPQSSDNWSDDDELTEPNIGELPSDPEARQAALTLLLFKLGQCSGHPKEIEQAYALGYRAAEKSQQNRLRDELFQRWLGEHTLDDATGGQLAAGWRALMDAFDSIPDITLSKWSCGLGGYWEPVRHALRALRFDQGLNLDSPANEFDSRGWLFSRRDRRPTETTGKEPDRS